MCLSCNNQRDFRMGDKMRGVQAEITFESIPPPKKLSLAEARPDLAAEWDYDKNGDLCPDQVTAFSNRKVWWKCRNCGQSWQATINNRSNGRGCPFDARKRPVPNQTDLATMHPDLAEEWDYERNGDLRPEQFTAKSGRKVWWKCGKCGQSWQAAIYSRTDGHGCPFDAGQRPILGQTDLSTMHPNLVEEWDYERNGDLKPEQLTANSGRKVWWKCRNCGQSWQAAIYSRTNGYGCPFDAGRRPILGQTDLSTLCPDLAKEWDYERNGNLRPEQVAAKSHKKVWWKCRNCGQSWQATIGNRTNGHGCPFDAGQRPIPNQTDLATVCPDLAKEWDYERNGDLRPDQFTAKSHKKVWWKCEECGRSWQATISDRTKGCGCPRCNSGRKR